MIVQLKTHLAIIFRKHLWLSISANKMLGFEAFIINFCGHSFWEMDTNLWGIKYTRKTSYWNLLKRDHPILRFSELNLVCKQPYRERRHKFPQGILVSILHAHAVCPCCCPCCMFILHVHAAYPWCVLMLLVYHACPFCISFYILHANAACPCCFPRFMSMLQVHVPMLLAHAACPVEWSCCITMLYYTPMLHVHCPCCVPILISVSPCWCPSCMPTRHVHAGWRCCLNMLHENGARAEICYVHYGSLCAELGSSQ
jgi:hypothetical protein